MRPFDVCGPLPTGTTVLEASAGTGKTFTIAALAARYIAEDDVRIDQMMLVTFGRMATAELRERVRERLAATALALTDPATARTSPDDVVRHLAAGTDTAVDVRRSRLARAAADFDAATIATTHGFSHQMLTGLGVAADLDPDVTFVEDLSDVVSEVVTDLYVRAYGRPDSGEPPFSITEARALAVTAVNDPQARLEPRDAAPDSAAGLRRRFAEAVRAEVERRKRTRRVIDYDDLLVQLCRALADDVTGPDACARVRSRYRIVLVDEFQDTDPVQWEILERAFHGHRTLVLIGDPKQAIYAFRGADVVTYLQARGAGSRIETLGTNWRSDRPLVDALGHVMGGSALGDPGIHVHPVDAAHGSARLQGPVATPLRLRVVDRQELTTKQGGLIGVADARPYVAADVAADVARLLSSDTFLEEDDAKRPVRPADIAVLAQRNKDAYLVRDALVAAGVPAVLTGASSVFLSRAAQDWLTLLAALEQPQRPGLARAAALTSFVGWSAADLADDEGESFDELGARLHEWAAVLAARGVAALLETIVAHGLVSRVLARVDGERALTDLRHIGQELHAAVTRDQLGIASLVEWLQRRIAEAQDEVDEERSRRLESDAEAVQVITVHRSKGLEFPVVYTPFLWDRWVPKTPDHLRLHDADGERILDIGGPGSEGYAGRLAAHAAEDAGESLRLAYVALTRARCQVVAHYAPAGNTATSPLHRFLFGSPLEDGSLPETVPVPSDDLAMVRALRTLASDAAGLISVERADGGDGATWDPGGPAYDSLAVRRFDRALDDAWTRTSYTGLTRGLHEAAHAGGVHAGGVHAGGVTSETEAPGTVDEPVVELVPGVGLEPGAEGAEGAAGSADGTDAAPAAATLASPMADLPKGAAFGTLVHGILEHTDFAAPDLREHLVTQCGAAGASRFLGVPAADLAAALEPSLLTPLGPLAGGRRLADVERADRLDEMDFELPLLGGDTPTGEATIAQIGDLLADHLAPDDPLAGFADDLRVPALAAAGLRGFLGGSIDLVLRVRDGDGPPRHLVVDYKTNWIGGETTTAADYHPAAMAATMRASHYPLQALLYNVALHRYLRWRQPGYDPADHLGGVLYLFLRGMCGPDTPVTDGMPHGVFAWAPPVALVTGLSDLLDRGVAR